MLQLIPPEAERESEADRKLLNYIRREERRRHAWDVQARTGGRRGGRERLGSDRVTLVFLEVINLY